MIIQNNIEHERTNFAKRPVPSKGEKQIAKMLQSLFDFETNITYHLYDYGKRSCTIMIEAAGELPPPINSSTNDYGRGPNSTVLAKFARKKLPKGEGIWYSMGNGFMIDYYAAVEYFINNPIKG